jgi:hypothetical protein
MAYIKMRRTLGHSPRRCGVDSDIGRTDCLQFGPGVAVGSGGLRVSFWAKAMEGATDKQSSAAGRIRAFASFIVTICASKPCSQMNETEMVGANGLEPLTLSV